MRIALKVFGTLRKYFDSHTQQLDVKEGAKISDIYSMLENQTTGIAEELFNEGKVKPQFIVLVNGRRIDLLDGTETALAEGDEISIFPPVAGG